jgi:myosin heavy subunit
MKKETVNNHMIQGIPPRNTRIWVPDATCVWKQAEFISFDEKKKKIAVNYNDGSGPCLIDFDSTFHLCNEQDASSLSDLAQLPHLHEAALLDAIKNRFHSNIIYTYTGPILLAVNPFEKLPNMYETSVSPQGKPI